MATPRRALGIRLQLLGLFGLMLLSGAVVLLLDEAERQRNAHALAELKDGSLASLRRIKSVSDAYGLDITDTTFRVRNYLISWEAGVIVLDSARMRIDEHWAALAQMPRTEDQETLFRQIVDSRRRADIATANLRDILQRRDIEALGQFADTELYPAMDPIASRLKLLGDLEMIRAEQRVRAADERARQAAWLRNGISLLALAIVMAVGQSLLRNIFKGVEALTWLAGRMGQQDFEAQPRFVPEGELGEVMDSFLHLRDDVRGFAGELTRQLHDNEQVRAELQQRELFQHSLLAAAQVAIMAFDLEGRFTSVNPYAERLSGWRAVDLLGRRGIHELLDVTELRRVASALSTALDRRVLPDGRLLPSLIEQGTPPMEWTLTRPDGRTLPVLLATSPLRDASGATVGYLGVGTDLSQIKELERQLRASEVRAREASAAKSAFLAAMSHEIRTPMIGVTGMLEVLAHSPLDLEQQRTIQIIQQSAAALLQIIGDILDFSKVEAGRMELAPTTIDLTRLLQSTVANFSGSASSKGLVLSCRIDPRVGPAYLVDGLRLRQVVSNLLSNAIKFTEHGSVELVLDWLEASGPNDRLRLSVIDTGIGIAPDQQTRLFQPFQQAEGSTSRRFGGTGLGLAIARRLAELLGGRLDLDSAPGRGSTLSLGLSLPRGRAEDVEAEPGVGTPDSFPTRALPSIAEAVAERSLILIVDDHPTNRLVVARQLALAGFASESAVDGRDGLNHWRSGRYALVLSDVHMPEMDGYEFARELRRIESEEARVRTPVVALTAAALKGEAERCFDAGMDDYLAKPVSISQLVACLQRWLPHIRDSLTGKPGELPQLGGAPQVLDESVLLAIVGNDRGQARAVLADFLETTASDLDAVQSARLTGDLARLAREAHKIKGAARLVGASQLAECAAATEHAAQAADWPQLLPRLADLVTATERLRLYVEGLPVPE